MTIVKSNRSGIQVISRAVTILKLLQQSPEPASLGSIAKKINLPRSTVQRIVNALSNEGFVISGPSSRGIRLGPELIALASTAQVSIKDIARPILDSLANETNESVALTTLNNQEVITLDQIQSSKRLASFLSSETTLPLYCSASGKAMLAILEKEQLNSFLSELKLIEFTNNTITSKQQLLSELEEIRRTGVAYDQEEHSYGVCASAIATKTVTGSFIAFAVTIPSTRFNEAKHKTSKLLQTHIDTFKQSIKI